MTDAEYPVCMHMVSAISLWATVLGYNMYVKRFCGPVYILVGLSYISHHFPPKQGDRGNEGSKRNK